MSTVAWFHCFSGISGDMTLGALLDAGADLDEVRSLLRRLPVTGWELEAEATMRNGIAATKALVITEETSVVRTYAHITGLIEEGRLPDPVRTRALGVFRCLAEAEGRLHRRPMSQVHFHEVGGIDAIVDVVGSAAALHVLGVDEVRSSAVATGMGMIKSAHGRLPNPAPAVVELLRGAPTYGLDLSVELTTPTGAAILAGLCRAWGPMPTMTVQSSGFGAGAHELEDHPNLLQVVTGSVVAEAERGQPVMVMETTVDDVTGEQLAHAVESLLEAGALDVWVTAVTMKKGRPGHVVTVLCDPVGIGRLRDVLTAETGSLGVRVQRMDRWPARRRSDDVEVEGMPIRRKIGPHRVKAEYDDAARAARLTGLPLREVQRRAEEPPADPPEGTWDWDDEPEPA